MANIFYLFRILVSLQNYLLIFLELCVRIKLQNQQTIGEIMITLQQNYMARFGTLAMVAALTACGGGGSDDKTQSATGAPTVPQVVQNPGNLATSVPTPTYALGTDERKLFDDLNRIRLEGDFGMIAQDVNIDKAANAHAKYLTQNYLTRVDGVHKNIDSLGNIDPSTGWMNAHVENVNWPGFRGILPNDRISSFGGKYVYGAEVIAFSRLNRCLGLLLNSVFHRSALLNTDLQFVGIGFDKTNEYPNDDFGSACIINTATKERTNQTKTNWTGIYPSSNQTNVVLGMTSESPDPAPEIPDAEKGLPVTIYTDKNISTVTSFTLTASGSTVPIPVKLIVKKDFPTYLTDKEAHILPTKLLLKGTSYNVSFKGTLVDGTLVNRDWSFRTIS